MKLGSRINLLKNKNRGKIPALSLISGNNLENHSLVNFSRNSSKWIFNNAGELIEAPSNTLPTSYDPETGETLGWYIEEERTRLNTIAAAPSNAENVTVTNVAHTISFYGNGTVTLSGTATATINGEGAFPTRTILTFTPTAGTLTITPTGDVQHLQLEIGTFVTSPILGDGSTVTRPADAADITDMSWYNNVEGTLFCEASSNIPNGTNAVGARAAPWMLYLDDGNNTRVNLEDSIDNIFLRGYVGGAPSGGLQIYPSFNLGEFYKCAWYTDATNYGGTVNGDPVDNDTENYSGVAMAKLFIGSCEFSDEPREFLNGFLRSILYYDERLINSDIEKYTS